MFTREYPFYKEEKPVLIATLVFVAMAAGLLRTFSAPIFVLIPIMALASIIAPILLGYIPRNTLLWLTFRIRRSDPQTIREQCYERRIEWYSKVRDRRRVRQPGSMYGHDAGDNFSSLAKRYSRRAQYYWGRSSARDVFRAAWFYVVAGDLYKMADPADKEKASKMYHFAANALREVESYERSIEYYEKAAQDSSDPAWTMRNLQRAMGVAKVCGDDEKAGGLRQDIISLYPSICRELKEKHSELANLEEKRAEIQNPGQGDARDNHVKDLKRRVAHLIKIADLRMARLENDLRHAEDTSRETARMGIEELSRLLPAHGRDGEERL
ncbi:MAG: hypothetical protein L0K86_05200 [Actinomycetia bacterium]|nr:hypothetical protein [Actinomycetes bacterium]